MRRCTSLVLVVSTALSACVYSNERHAVDPVSIEPGKTTKEDLVQQFGAPRGIRRQGDDQVVTFVHGGTNGTGYGLGTLALAFAVESTHTGLNSLEVVIGRDRVVRSFRLAQVPHKTPKWVVD